MLGFSFRVLHLANLLFKLNLLGHFLFSDNKLAAYTQTDRPIIIFVLAFDR